jgi:hypothetical protein
LPKKDGGRAAVIVIDPKEFHRIEGMPVYWRFVQIQRGTMGAALAINKAGSVLPQKPTKGARQGRRNEAGSLLDTAHDRQKRPAGFLTSALHHAIDECAAHIDLG